MNDGTFAPGPNSASVRTGDGRILSIPEGWILLPPGDAALTRRVKAAGEHWAVQEKRGSKTFSRGVWILAETLERIRAELEAERSTESFAKKKASDFMRREKVQAAYVEDFRAEVVRFLAFHENYSEPRRSEAARWPGRKGFPSGGAPRPPRSPGCGTGQPGTTEWR